MTDQRLTLAAWKERRRAICAGFVAAGEDEERLLALAKELVAWEESRPTGNLNRVRRVFDVRYDGFEFVHELNHDLVVGLTDRQIARLLWCMERGSIQVWRCYAP